MTGGDLKILGVWCSPFVMRPRIAFALKSIDYKLVEENIFAKSELLLKTNPVYKKIPVLLHNSNSICESLVILQYIDEAFTSGPSLLPSDPYDRAIARFWASYVDDKLFSLMYACVVANTDEEKAAASEGMNTGLRLLEEAFEKISKGKGFFGGERIGYLDIVLGSQLGIIRVCEKFTDSTYIDDTKTPVLVEWSERFCADAAVKDLMPDTDKLVECVRKEFGS